MNDTQLSVSRHEFLSSAGFVCATGQIPNYPASGNCVTCHEFFSHYNRSFMTKDDEQDEEKYKRNFNKMKRIITLIIGACVCFSKLSAQTYEELVGMSYEHSDACDWLAAEECLKKALRLEPGHALNFALLNNLGTIQRRQGKTDDALFSYTIALSQRPHDEVMLINRAELYTEADEIDKAIFDYNTLISNSPEHEQGLYNRGILYIKKGDFLLAEADFERIIETNSETFLGRLGYGILEKARRNYDDSEVIFNYLAEKHADNIRLLEERAELFFMTKRNYRAMTDINKIFAAIPEPAAEIYMLRGRVKLAQTEKASAAMDFKKARDLGYDKESVERLLKECF